MTNGIYKNGGKAFAMIPTTVSPVGDQRAGRLGENLMIALLLIQDLEQEMAMEPLLQSMSYSLLRAGR